MDFFLDLVYLDINWGNLFLDRVNLATEPNGNLGEISQKILLDGFDKAHPLICLLDVLFSLESDYCTTEAGQFILSKGNSNGFFPHIVDLLVSKNKIPNEGNRTKNDDTIEHA